MTGELDGLITISRCGVVLEPDPSDDREVEGVLNPAVAGNYLLYRAVGKGNYSRIMVAKLAPPTNPNTCAVAQKLNRVVLEPHEAYELSSTGRGGIEDPRVTKLSDGTFVMFYTGYGRPSGFRKQTPVVAAAVSGDGLDWHRLGRIAFSSHVHRGREIDFNKFPNKDTVLFSEKIGSRYAMLHRPMFTHDQAKAFGIPRRSIWYAEADVLTGPWYNHSLLVVPTYDWEHGGVGAGVPPIHLHDNWVHIYHGFRQREEGGRRYRYSAGVFVTPHRDPKQITFRSGVALLEPSLEAEITGTVPHVVFPTAVWEEEDTLDDDLTIFWGAADTRIMTGKLTLPSAALKGDVPAQASG